MAAACLKIVTHIIGSERSLDEITLKRLAEIAEVDSKEQILAVASVLATRFRVLHWRFVYFGPSGDPQYLSEDESQQFLNTGVYIDPDDGPVGDADKHIYPYFSADRQYLLAEVK